MTLNSSARWLLIAGVVVAVLLFVPVAWWPLMVGKLSLAGLCVALAGIAGAVALSRREAHVPALSLVALCLPVAYLISYFVSSQRAVGLVGGLDTDTLSFVALCATAAIIASMFVRDTSSGRALLRATAGALALAGIFQLVVLAVGLPGPFADRSVNLIGKWNDFALGMTLLSFVLLVELEWGSFAGWRRFGAWLGLLLALLLLGLVNFAIGWALLLAVALVAGAVAWVGLKRVPKASLLVVVVAVVFLLFGTGLSASLAKLLPASSLEVRPSVATTLSVIAASHGSSVTSAVFGTGPNTFSRAWLLYKPHDVNASAFWNLDFNVGFSTLLTAFASTGFVGLLAWLLFPLAVLWAMWRSRFESRVILQLGGMALMLWLAAAVYVPSASLLLVGFVLSGAVVGLSGAAPLRARAALGAALLLAVVAALSGLVIERRAGSEIFAAVAASQAQAGALDGAHSRIINAQAIEAAPEVLRLHADITTAQAAVLSQSTSTPQGQTQLTALLSEAAQAGKDAVAKDPGDYRSYLSLAQLYDFLARNQVAGALEGARAYYEAAARLAPLNPSIPLSLAKLEAAAGTSTEALKGYLSRTLSLKPDYTDAILFVVQLDIAQNDLPSAVRDTTVAVQTAPGVPSLWFELGLLYYAQNDTKNAIPALEQALSLEPSYANARYFLGLSYAAEGRVEEARALFEKLAQDNPSNAELKGILENLRAGKPPISATTTPPVERPSAPIK